MRAMPLAVGGVVVAVDDVVTGGEARAEVVVCADPGVDHEDHRPGSAIGVAIRH